MSIFAKLCDFNWCWETKQGQSEVSLEWRPQRNLNIVGRTGGSKQQPETNSLKQWQISFMLLERKWLEQVGLIAMKWFLRWHFQLLQRGWLYLLYHIKWLLLKVGYSLLVSSGWEAFLKIFAFCFSSPEFGLWSLPQWTVLGSPRKFRQQGKT